MDRGVLRSVSASYAKENRIYGSRFAQIIKNEWKTHKFEKSWLVVQAHNDKDHGFPTYVIILQRVSQRLLLTIWDMDASFKFFTRDICKA